jgi:cell division septum initiation protein DivIVA
MQLDGKERDDLRRRIEELEAVVAHERGRTEAAERAAQAARDSASRAWAVTMDSTPLRKRVS